MGNSLSPLLTDIVLTELQNKSISKMGFMMKLIVKYVDDLLFIIPIDKIQQVLDILNSYHPNIKFTYEVMTNNKLPYLDTELIIRGYHVSKLRKKNYQDIIFQLFRSRKSH